MTTRAVALSPLAVQHFVGSDGAALVGGKLFAYIAGTTTKTDTYTDQSGATANTNPVILNARGECDLWLPAGQSFKFVLSPSTDTDPPTNPIWTVDQVDGVSGNIGEYVESVVLIPASINLTTNVPVNLGTITLSPGDWDVVAEAYFAGLTSTTVSYMQVAISDNSLTLDMTPGRYAISSGSSTTIFNGCSAVLVTAGPFRVSTPNAAKTLYAVAQGGFQVNIMNTFGVFRATRVK